MTRPTRVAGPQVDDGASALVLRLLQLQPIADDRYLADGTGLPGVPRLYGGQLVAQTLRAATMTVAPRYHAQSVHGYFVRAGRPNRPVELRVARVRDGRSFCIRQATAYQDAEPVFVLHGSFHVAEPGESFQTPLADDVARPEDDYPWLPRDGGPFSAAFDLREFEPEPPDDDGRYRSTRRFWARARGALPDDPAVHASVLAYTSDFGATMAAYVPTGVPFGAGTHASLDHGIWFHRSARLDDWVLVDFRPVSNAGSRGFVIGTVHSRPGELVATVTQEVLIRTGR